MTPAPLPVCRRCWDVRYPGRTAVRVRPEHVERCCYCAEPTTAGIHVLLEPSSVPYPLPYPLRPAPFRRRAG